MTITSDILRDAQGNVYRIFPEPVDGELTIDPDLWEDLWDDPTYTIPTGGRLTYRTLIDDAGSTWYMYPVNVGDLEGELAIDDTAPTPQAGVWSDPVYEEQTPTAGTTIQYMTYVDEDDKTWYIYPDANGELIITDTQPS